MPASAFLSPGAPVLRAVDLGGDRGGRRLFRHLSLSLEPGRIVWLRGRNGRGKTSLLRLLAGLATPAAGVVQIDGNPLRGAGPQWRQRLHYIGHPNALKEDLSVVESLRFGRRVAGPQRRPALTWIAALERLGHRIVWRRLPVRRLSQGQRRRAALARLALPQPPSVWLLDEPFDALDDDGIQPPERTAGRTDATAAAARCSRAISR